MRVLFDHQAFDMQRFGGVSRYYTETIPFLRQSIECKIAVRRSDNVNLHESGIIPNLKHDLHFNQGLLGKNNFHGKQWLIHHYEGWYYNRRRSVSLLQKNNFDIFCPTFYDSYFLDYLKHRPMVLTVHDMITERCHDLFPNQTQSIQKRLLCPLAAHIMVPTHHAKNDLVDILNIPPEKITVVSRGTPHLPATAIKPQISGPYILFVGTREPYKNFIPFIEQFRLVAQKHPELHLVCTGPGFSGEEPGHISRLGLATRTHHISPSPEQLSALYRNAVAFVFPSLYEGFGLPILEAWSCNCPVMLNNASCFPEVAGDAALFFEMNDKRNDFVEKFDYLYSMSGSDREALVEKGRQRMRLYTWENTAKKMLDVFLSVCQ